MTEDNKRSASRRQAFGLRGLALLAAMAAYLLIAPSNGAAQFKRGGGPGGGRPSDLPTPVAVEKAAVGDFPVYLSGLGTVTPLHTVVVRSRVDGELIRVAFTEGQMVKQGDLLAEIDPRAFQIQLQQAEGQLLRDEALLKNAEIDLARYRTLLQQDSIAAQQVMTQEWLVKQDRGTVEMDRAQVGNAKLQLAYAKVTAPVSGRVGLRLVDRGNIVHASDAGGLAVITQIEPIAVVFNLPEDQIPAVMKRWRAGAELPVEAYDRAGRTKLAEGKLLAVDNQIDATTGTVKLKAQFVNTDHGLFANQFVNIKLKLDTLRSAVLIPTAALQRGAVGSFVYAIKDDQTAQVRPVKLGPLEGDKAVVLEGVAANDTVVVDGADKLKEGGKVEIIGKSSTPADNPDGKRPAGS
jgi:multidrug efflux system membrane fusion protein